MTHSQTKQRIFDKEVGEYHRTLSPANYDNVLKAMDSYALTQSIAFAKWLEDTDKMKPFEYGSTTASLIDDPENLYLLFLHQTLQP